MRVPDLDMTDMRPPGKAGVGVPDLPEPARLIGHRLDNGAGVAAPVETHRIAGPDIDRPIDHQVERRQRIEGGVLTRGAQGLDQGRRPRHPRRLIQHPVDEARAVDAHVHLVRVLPLHPGLDRRPRSVRAITLREGEDLGAGPLGVGVVIPAVLREVRIPGDLDPHAVHRRIGPPHGHQFQWV